MDYIVHGPLSFLMLPSISAQLTFVAGHPSEVEGAMSQLKHPKGGRI